jgi:hypothetical protein
MSLWSFLKSRKFIRSPLRREQKIQPNIQRASFCICPKASYTIEAAVVIPLLAGYLVMFLFFFFIIEIQCEIDEALLYAGRKTAVESSVVESKEALFLSAEAYMIQVLKDNPKIERRIQHGIFGISLLRSDFDGEDVVLRADYVVKFPISFLGVGKIKLCSENRFRKWIGDRQEIEAGNYVYICASGDVFHASLSCQALDLTIQETSIDAIGNLRGKNRQKYYECSKCKWKDSRKEKIYYTDYGEFYHKDISCSNLKRMIEKVRLEDVDMRCPCSFCYEL